MRVINWLGLTVLLILLSETVRSQQLRLGDNPYTVEKSAVLDLVSTNQGLLLPRITDTTLIDVLNPPNGMIIYFVPTNKLLIRTNSQWQPIASENYLKLTNLTDVTVTLPSSGQLLQYNGSTWVNTTPSYLTSIDTTNITNFYQKVRGLFSSVTPITLDANGQISMSQAGASTDGYLNSSDWNTFNNKQAAGNYITALTGDISATGPGSVTATIAPNAVTYGKIQNVSATDRVLGRVSSGSGVIEEIPTTGTGNVVRSNSPTIITPTGIVKADVGLGNVDNTPDSSKPVSIATQAALNLKINLSQKGANNGVATLDAGGKVPLSQLAVGAQVYLGTWDASTNTPYVQDGTGSSGDTYRVVVGGTIDLGSGPITLYASDDIIYNGTIWQRNPSSVAVNSVNSQTGTVVLTTDNINEGTNNKYYQDSLARKSLSASAPLSYNSTNGNFSISQATTSTNGYLSSADWNTFNTKQNAGNYITALTGDVTASGPGSVGATIAPNAVTYSKIQAMTANRLLGSGASGTSVAEITLGTGLSFTGNTLNAATTGGTITSFSSGNLSPLFTTSVANPTSTPALSFSLNSQAQNLVFASPVNTSGTPTFRALAKTDLPSTGVYRDQSNTYTSGSKQIFSASGLYADIRLTGNSADPSTLANGDIWYNTTASQLKYRANGVTRVIANLNEAQTFSGKTISGSSNTLTNIGNSSLVNSTIGITLGTTGTDVNVSGTPASLGGNISLNIPSASATSRGLLTAADWTAFNTKLNSIDTTNISNFYLKVRSLLSAGAGITYNNSTGVITNSGVTSINNNTGALTMDTGYISNFYTKVRSLHTVSAPLTYNASTGLIGITQATSTTNGYLSSADWNAFNSKANSFSTGNLTETGSGVLTITGGSNAVVGSGTTIQVKQANASQNGFLSNTDWNTFNNKLSSVDTSNISNFSIKVRSLFTGGSGITYNPGTGLISSSINTGNFWNITGNSGTTPSTNFIGTTDNQDLVFRANNTERARIVAATGDLKIGDANSGTIRSTKELVLRQDGDTYGSSILRLRNRTAENGAIFETTDPSITLVDFIFKTAASQRNIRYEARSGYARAGTPSFHIGGANPDNPTLAVGDNYAAFNTNLKIGDYNTPAEALDVTGNVRFSGALMPDNDPGTSGYLLKSNGSGTAPTWVDAAPVTTDNYVFAYSTSNKTFTGAGNWTDITFETAHPELSGWTHSLISSAQNFTCNQTGLYQVIYSGSVNNSGGGTRELDIRATLNGTEIPGSVSSVYAAGPNPNIANNFLVSVTSGQVLKLQLTGSNTSVQLVPGTYGTTRPSITLTIIRIK